MVLSLVHCSLCGLIRPDIGAHFRSGRKRRLSSRRSPSGQSLGSIGSYPDLLSPCVPTTATSGGFAARKSAYTGVIGSSDDEDDGGGYVVRRRPPVLISSVGHRRYSSDEEDGPSSSPRRLPSDESMPTTEDFITYLVLKGEPLRGSKLGQIVSVAVLLGNPANSCPFPGINCVPDELKYIGGLPWETIPLKRKTNQSGIKKAAEVSPSVEVRSCV